MYSHLKLTQIKVQGGGSRQGFNSCRERDQSAGTRVDVLDRG